ncbi:hypothetical protein CK203_062747 [Vitis vinifera]|uniref:Uncharacterized protein n=1 Tax=Vitis vinifera TaxID=29760 RepID=A0A438GAW7_VITVI|nr:hypothetical protein CK203_062747 [Vitis vinifera]
MATVRRKRNEHLPATCSQVKLPKSWCSGEKFISVIARLPDDKQDAITEMGFGGLLHLEDFLIFACAALLAPNSKLEGIHDLWDTIWDGDIGVQKNWSKFVLHYIEDGIKEYQKNQSIRGCLIFLQAAGGQSSASDDATEVVNVFIDSQAHICIVVLQLVADFALDEDADSSEVVCDMHRLFITRVELASLNGGRWVNNIIIGVMSRMLNANQPHPRRCHYFNPSFSVVLASLYRKPEKKKYLTDHACFFKLT